MTSFDDEETQNCCPVVDVHDPEVQSKYISIMVKSMYILPGVRHTDICAEILATKEYNKACQSGDVKMLDTHVPLTFRQQKTIIKFVFNLVIQFKVSDVTDPEMLKNFTTVDGITPSRIILLERTKRNMNTEDSTVKCKSVLLYYQVDAGVLVSHVTVILNRSIPVLLSKLMDNLGGRGSVEAGETADNTRKYLIKKFGDSREN